MRLGKEKAQTATNHLDLGSSSSAIGAKKRVLLKKNQKGGRSLNGIGGGSYDGGLQKPQTAITYIGVP